MAKKNSSKTSASSSDNSVKNHNRVSAQPRFHQSAREIQPFGTVTSMQPLQLDEPVRLEMTEQLNLLLADTMTLRDLYKKSHWQVAGPTFYQLHLLFDKHYEEQSELVDTIAERIQLLGGISHRHGGGRGRDDTGFRGRPKDARRCRSSFRGC